MGNRKPAMFTFARICALRYTDAKLPIIFCLTLSFSEEVHILFLLVAIKQFLAHWLAQVWKGLSDLYILITVSHWEKSVRNSSRNGCRNHGGMLITVLSTYTICSGCFLIQPRSTFLALTQLTVSRVISHQSLIKKMHYRLAQRPIW